MNEIQAVRTDYITASRTIETISVKSPTHQTVFFVYNYEGYSFRLFRSIIKLIEFFNGNAEADGHFGCEEGLDEYLSNIQVSY